MKTKKDKLESMFTCPHCDKLVKYDDGDWFESVTSDCVGMFCNTCIGIEVSILCAVNKSLRLNKLIKKYKD